MTATFRKRLFLTKSPTINQNAQPVRLTQSLLETNSHINLNGLCIPLKSLSISRKYALAQNAKHILSPPKNQMHHSQAHFVALAFSLLSSSTKLPMDCQTTDKQNVLKDLLTPFLALPNPTGLWLEPLRCRWI